MNDQQTSQALAPIEGQPSSTMLNAFASSSSFELAQRMAKALSSSTLVPEAYRNNIPNVIIAMELASRIGASVFAVMQNIDIIHGRPAWRATFLIATVNACGRFTPLRYRWEGQAGKTTWGCRAYAKDRETGEECIGALITIALADSEGWSKKSGSKWKTMPEQMLMYRAAAFWTRVYAPELSLGMHTADEVEDVGTPTVSMREPTVAQISDIASRVTMSADRNRQVLAQAQPTDAEPQAEEPAAEPSGETAYDPETGEIHELPDEVT